MLRFSVRNEERALWKCSVQSAIVSAVSVFSVQPPAEEGCDPNCLLPARNGHFGWYKQGTHTQNYFQAQFCLEGLLQGAGVAQWVLEESLSYSTGVTLHRSLSGGLLWPILRSQQAAQQNTAIPNKPFQPNIRITYLTALVCCIKYVFRAAFFFLMYLRIVKENCFFIAVQVCPLEMEHQALLQLKLFSEVACRVRGITQTQLCLCLSSFIRKNVLESQSNISLYRDVTAFFNTVQHVCWCIIGC